MAINTNDILRCALRWIDPWGNDYVNTCHFRVVARGTGTDITLLTDIATYWLTNFNNYAASFSNGYISEDMRAERVEWSGGKEVVLETFPIVSVHGVAGGTNGGDSLPPNVGPVVTFRTAGVRTLPKQYLMPPCEDKYGMTGFGSATLSGLAAFIAWYLSDVVGIGYSAATIRAVVHSKRAVDWVVFLAGVVEKYCSHQNRRKTGVGS